MLNDDFAADVHVTQFNPQVPPGKRVFVSGTWNSKKAELYASAAFDVGAAIGQAGLDLACGPGTGVAAHVVDGFRSASSTGMVDFFLPHRQSMLEVGEVIGRHPDRIIQTDFDYPLRNVFQISYCSALIAVTGGDGTLEEILPALIDYRIPVGLLVGSGSAPRVISSLARTEYPEWLDLLIESEDHHLVAQRVIEEVRRRG